MGSVDKIVFYLKLTDVRSITVTMMSRITINLKKQNAMEYGGEITNNRVRTMSFSCTGTGWSQSRTRPLEVRPYPNWLYKPLLRYGL